MKIVIANHVANYVGTHTPGDDHKLINHTFRICSSSLDYALLPLGLKNQQIDIVIPASVVASVLKANKGYNLAEDGRKKKK